MAAAPLDDDGCASSSGGDSTWTMYLASSEAYGDDGEADGGSDGDVVDDDGGDSMASDACSAPFHRGGAEYEENVDEDEDDDASDDGNVDNSATRGSAHGQKRSCGMQDDRDEAAGYEEDGGGESIDQDDDDYS